MKPTKTLSTHVRAAEEFLRHSHRIANTDDMRNAIRDAVHELNLALQRLNEIERNNEIKQVWTVNQLPELQTLDDDELVALFRVEMFSQVQTIHEALDHASGLAMTIGYMTTSERISKDARRRAMDEYLINDEFRREFQKRVDQAG